MQNLKKLILFSIPVPLVVGLWLGSRSFLVHEKIWPIAWINLLHKSQHPILRVLSYNRTLPPALIQKFEHEFKATVLVDTVLNSSSMLDRLSERPIRYDVVVPDSYQLASPIELGQITRLHARGFSNWTDLSNDLIGHNGPIYSAPLLWGAMGYLVASDSSFTSLSKGWSASAHFVFWPDPIDLYLNLLRVHLLSTSVINDEGNVQSALSKLLQNSKLRDMESSAVNSLLAGKVEAVEVSQGRAVSYLQKNPQLRFVIPRDGSTLWLRSAAIIKNSEQKASARAFVNFLLKPANARTILNYSQEATAIGALDSDPNINEMQKASYLRKLPLGALVTISKTLALRAVQLQKWIKSMPAKNSEITGLQFDNLPSRTQEADVQ